MTSVDGLSLLGNVQHNSLKGVVTLHSNSTLTKPANSKCRNDCRRGVALIQAEGRFWFQDEFQICGQNAALLGAS